MLKNIVNHGIYGKEPLYQVRDISTLRDLFESSTTLFENRIAFLQKYGQNTPYKEITYKEYRDDVYSFATGLINLGLKDKKIAVIGESRYEWVCTYTAVVCGVGTIIPIDKELPYEEVKFLLDFSESSCVVCSKAMLSKMPELMNATDMCICMDAYDGCKSFDEVCIMGKKSLLDGDKTFENITVEPDDINVILFTSGTTGTAKGVMLSHKNFCTTIVNSMALFQIKPTDRAFSVLPIHHTFECSGTFLCFIFSGASVAFCQGLKYLVKNMQEAKPTMVCVVPMILEAIRKNIEKTLEKKGKTETVKKGIKISKGLLKVGIDVRRKLFKEIIATFGGNLNSFLVGAAKVNPETLAFYRDIGIDSLQGYGMTECAPFVAINRFCRNRDDSVGLPLPEIEIKVVNPDKNGIGELAVKGENVMAGYYKNQEETDKVLIDGWMMTGDLGYIDDGFIYLTGRAKNLIITDNGKNVYPEEIEEYLLRSKYIEECMVYAGDDNKISAKIFPNFEEVEGLLRKEYTDEQLNELIGEEIKAINKDIPLYKAIASFSIRKEEFVKTTTKKIKRTANM